MYWIVLQSPNLTSSLKIHTLANCYYKFRPIVIFFHMSRQLLLLVVRLRHIRRAGGLKQWIVNRTVLSSPPAQRSCPLSSQFLGIS